MDQGGGKGGMRGGEKGGSKDDGSSQKPDGEMGDKPTSGQQ